MAAGLGGLPRVPRGAARIALLGLFGLAVWAFASIAWADVRGDAWNGADRMLLYLVVFCLFLVIRWRPGVTTLVLGAYVLATAIVAAIALARAGSGRLDFFIDGRLAYPTGYPNANAGLFLSGFWVALILATRRQVAAPLRVVAAMAAALLPQVALLSQSRATLVAFPVTAVVLTLIVPGRLRTAAGVVVAGLVIAATWSTHTAVFDAAHHGGPALERALDTTSRTAAISMGLVGLAALAWAIADRRLRLSERSLRRLNRSALAAAALAGLALAAVVLASDPLDRARRGWQTFTTVAPERPQASQSRFELGIGSNRYDFWRVAIKRFEANPLTGIGADNFSVDYLRERKSAEEPAYPHSLQVMMLSQLGLIGTFLLVVVVVAGGAAAAPRARDDPATAALAGAAIAGPTYFLVHASVDWFWEIPGLGAPAFALLGLAASLRSARPVDGSGRASRTPTPVLGLAAVAVVAGAGALAFPWLSHRQIDSAVSVWRSDPAAAYDRLSSARSLNPLSAQPDLIAGAIAARLDDRPRMARLFARSLKRNPYSWYAQLELGLSESLLGNRAASVTALRRAIALNPREPVLHDVLRRLEMGKTIHPSSLDSLFVDRISSRTR